MEASGALIFSAFIVGILCHYWYVFVIGALVIGLLCHIHTRMKVLILFMLMGGVCMAEEQTYFDTKPYKHKCVMYGVFSFRYPIELEYSDVILCARETAYYKWLGEISAKEFLEKYCMRIDDGIYESK